MVTTISGTSLSVPGNITTTNNGNITSAGDVTSSGDVEGSSFNGGQLGGRRNLIINGAMEVWQRGTSQTSSGGYAADRFWMVNASSAARDTDAPSGFTYSTKLTYGSTSMLIGQPIELPDTGKQGQLVSGQTVTLSYYAKVDTDTEPVVASIKFRDTKFSNTNEVAFTSSNSSATWTTTWTRYTHSFTIPSINSTNVVAALEIGNIDRTAYITGVQLELGETATPFEHRSYGEELALCERYYETGLMFVQSSTHANGSTLGTSSIFATQKRTTPTVGLTATSSFGLTSGPSTQGITEKTVGMNAVFNAAGGAFTFVNFTADAEL